MKKILILLFALTLISCKPIMFKAIPASENIKKALPNGMQFWLPSVDNYMFVIDTATHMAYEVRLSSSTSHGVQTIILLERRYPEDEKRK